jgi:hypothetical protein
MATDTLRRCLRAPIQAIFEAVQYLDDAVTAHLQGDKDRAEERICRADISEVRAWTESLWGANSPYAKPLIKLPESSLVAPGARTKARMPTLAEQRLLHERDGYHCRFCGIPVIRAQTRRKIQKAYPAALSWGTKNSEQHAAFQAMWAQYDHVVPHAHGGTNDLENLIVTCAPCNFGKMNYTLEQLDLVDPRISELVTSAWDGLERFV